MKISEYEIIEDLKNGAFKVLRHGEEWRDLTGDNLFLAMYSKLEEQQEEIKRLTEGIDRASYCLANEDTYDVDVVEAIRMECLVKLIIKE